MMMPWRILANLFLTIYVKKIGETITNQKANSKDIWDDNEVLDDVDIDDSLDPREQPEYDYVAKIGVKFSTF